MLFIALIFYIFSSLLNIIFNKWIIILGSLIILTLLIIEILLKNKEKAILEINNKLIDAKKYAIIKKYTLCKKYNLNIVRGYE